MGLEIKNPIEMILRSHHLISRPQHEQLLDVEFGHRYTSEKFNISTNFYHMQYKNQ